MASFRCYGNSNLGEMYPIWKFHLSLARHYRLIFCWTDNGAVQAKWFAWNNRALITIFWNLFRTENTCQECLVNHMSQRWFMVKLSFKTGSTGDNNVTKRSQEFTVTCSEFYLLGKCSTDFYFYLLASFATRRDSSNWAKPKQKSFRGCGNVYTVPLHVFLFTNNNKC